VDLAEDVDEDPRFKKIRKYNTLGEARNNELVVLVSEEDVAVCKVLRQSKRDKMTVVVWMGVQERTDAGLPQRVRGEFHLVDSPCQWDPKCPKRELGQSVAQHKRMKKAVGAEREECPCGGLWRAKVEANTGVLAARFKLQDGKLPALVNCGGSAKGCAVSVGLAQ